MDINRPHTAVINIRIEVHVLDDKGQCSGKVLNDSALSDFGIRPSFLLSVDGIDAEDCLNKLKEKLRKLYD